MPLRKMVAWSLLLSVTLLAPPALGQPRPLESIWDEIEGVGGEVPELPPLRSRAQPPIASVRSLTRAEDLVSRARRDHSGRLVVEVGGEVRPLTLDAGLQSRLDRILANYDPPYAAVVALEPGTGRVLAMVEHSRAQPSLRGLTTAAVFPAASVFKVVTAAALLDAGLTPDVRECYHGGKRRLRARHLVDSKRDRRCQTLASAMGTSANVVFAKLAVKHLAAEDLRGWAAALGFNRRIDFPIPTEISSAWVPEDELGFASTAAGFGDVFMSPLHAAALAAVPANRGVWREPVLFDDEATDAPGQRVMTPEQALELEDMLERTVTRGTARDVFRERGFRVRGAVGKTGSLNDRRPFRDYTWFVGYAPRHDPQVAVAALIVNDPIWRIRAPWLAREAMRLYLAREREAPAASAEDEDTN